MTGIIERAEAALEQVTHDGTPCWRERPRELIVDLVAELKAARAENKKLRSRQQKCIPVSLDLDNSPELDALLPGAVLFDGDQDVVIKDHDGIWRYWGSTPDSDEEEAVVCLPAQVIWEPDGHEC